MALRTHLINLLDGNILADERIELPDKLSRLRKRLGHIEMCEHHAGIDSSVGTARTDNLHVGTHYGRQRRLNHRLHRHFPRLALPTVERRATVGQTHEISRLSHSGQSFSIYV